MIAQIAKWYNNKIINNENDALQILEFTNLNFYQ